MTQAYPPWGEPQPSGNPAPQPGFPQAPPGIPPAQPAFPQAPPAFPQAPAGFPQVHPDVPQAQPGGYQGYYDQQPPARPGYYQQPPPGYPATGATAIAITMRYAPIAFLLGLFTPVLTVNGQPVPVAWKRPAVLPVGPGQYHVHAHVPYLIPTRIGKADLVVNIGPGQTADLEYRAPLIAFLRGALGPAPQRYPGMAAAVAINVIALVAVIVGVFGVVNGRGGAGGPDFSLPTGKTPAIGHLPDNSVPSFPVDPSFPAVPTFPGQEPESTPTTAAPAAGEPVLRPGATVRKVAGATFTAGEKSYTMAFKGWPFAFRTPPTWGCIGGKIDLPDTLAWVCVNEQDSSGGERTGIILRPCPAACSVATRQKMDKEWFLETAGLKRVNAVTQFRQTAKNAKGKYQLEFSHFFTDPATKKKYQVGVDAQALPLKKSSAQKVVNDIFSQTTF
ncbi:hypothetical protein [Actinoplanes awajinensis]|uniref:hypothetical protein n=1 Tax=Actinoplanes awajinensis TaxID=135946 RepID=UPI000A825F55|nr:hypothetical protein [Actinoplanes awajinensis]